MPEAISSLSIISVLDSCRDHHFLEEAFPLFLDVVRFPSSNPCLLSQPSIKVGWDLAPCHQLTPRCELSPLHFLYPGRSVEMSATMITSTDGLQAQSKTQ